MSMTQTNQLGIEPSGELGAIDRFGLYADKLATRPRSEIIDDMRKDIDLEVVSTDLVTQKNTMQQAPKASIAFTVSFDHQDARLSQQVTSRLTDLYLAENA